MTMHLKLQKHAPAGACFFHLIPGKNLKAWWTAMLGTLLVGVE